MSVLDRADYQPNVDHKRDFSQEESSEEFIGEWMELRGNRDQMVIATKVCAKAHSMDKRVLIHND